MELCRLHCLDSEFLNSNSTHRLLLFEERRKCLNSVFWSIYRALKKQEKLILVVDKDEELEYLNYFFSRYKMQSLCLILNQENDFVSWHTVQKFKNYSYPEVDNKQFEVAAQEMVEELKRFEGIYKLFRKASLGKLNMIEAYQKLTNYTGPLLKLDVFNHNSVQSYREKKQLIQQAEDLFDFEFKYNAQYSIFRKGVFDEHTPESLLAILNHLKEGSEKLLSDIEEKEADIYSQVESSYIERFNKANILLDQLNQFRQMDSNPTVEAKINFTIESLQSMVGDRIQLKNSEEDPIEEKISEWERIERTNLHKEFASILKRVNNHNSRFEVNTIFQNAEACLTEALSANILNTVSISFIGDLLSARQVIRQLDADIAKAIHFLESDSAQLAWCVFYSKQSEENKLIIDQLLEIKSDWLSCFEASYIRSFLQNMLPKSQSLVKLNDGILDSIKKFEENAYVQIFEGRDRTEAEKSIEAISEIKQGLLWSAFLKDQGEHIFNAFPLLVVKTDFFNEHAARLMSHADQLCTVNYIPEQQYGKQSKLLMAGYKSSMQKAIEKYKDQEDFEVFKLDGVEFNINRSAHFLKGTELNKLSQYLAEGIRYFNSDFRIFQLRDKSILTLMSKEKNAELYLRLGDYGIKEILTHDESQNLIPAILNENIKSTAVLLEDMMLNPLDSGSILEQKYFLEKMQIAGLNIISVDNHRMMSSRMDEMALVVKRILGSTKEEATFV